MYQRRIGYVFCIVLLLLFAGCKSEVPAQNTPGNSSEITKEPEQTEINEQTVVPEQTDLTGTSDATDLREEPEFVEYTYPFYKLWCVADTDQSYEVTDDGACHAVFHEQYSQLIFALPEGINMALCDQVTVKAKSEYADLAVKLYDKTVYIDPWKPDVYTRYDCRGEAVQDYELYPDLTCDVWGIGLMSSDNVEDFSQYEVDAYSVTFHMRTEE